MAYRLAPLPKTAAKFIRAQTEKQRQAIYDALRKICETPLRDMNIKRLKGRRRGQFRYRLGDIRIIYTVDAEKETVTIVAIGQRGRIYKAP
ncbi:MAG: type II toxin-antitoxin system RelE/ParE family toxin [Chloroflexi bacterium]|nr:type II toxin-antitoxin system RelE/ParE family toxin [Chloroflexota bacterium]